MCEQFLHDPILCTLETEWNAHIMLGSLVV